MSHFSFLHTPPETTHPASLGDTPGKLLYLRGKADHQATSSDMHQRRPVVLGFANTVSCICTLWNHIAQALGRLTILGENDYFHIFQADAISFAC